MSGIKLPCRAQSKDTVEVLGIDTVAGIPVVQLITRYAQEGDEEKEICLDEEHARALFNWLGVWLHGGNRD